MLLLCIINIIALIILEKQKSFKAIQVSILVTAIFTTILFSYDEKLKCSNSKGFLLQTI